MTSLYRILPAAMMLCASSLMAAEQPAAQVDASVQPLTLEAAIAAALRNNETSDISLARIRRVEATLERARSAMLPQVTLGGSASTSTTNEVPHGGQANEALNWNANASIMLFNPTAWRNYAATRDILRAQTSDSLDMRRALAFTTSDIFLSVLAAEQQVVAAQRRLEVSHQVVVDARARLTAGLSTQTDVTRAELTVAQSQLAMTQAQRGVIANRLALDDLTAQNDIGPLAQPEPIAVASREYATLLPMAARHRPDLQALRWRSSAAEKAKEAAYGRYLPTVSAQAGLNHVNSNDPAYASVDNESQVTMSLVATWTLYDGGDREGAIGEAAADEREAGLTFTAQVRGLRKTIQTVLADLETSEASVTQAEAGSRLAKANADEVRARYQQGLATALDSADAISGQFNADSALVAARLDLARAKLALRKTIGSWPLTSTEPDQPTPGTR